MDLHIHQSRFVSMYKLQLWRSLDSRVTTNPIISWRGVQNTWFFYTIFPLHPSTQFPLSIRLHNFPSLFFYTIFPLHSSTQFPLSLLLHNFPLFLPLHNFSSPSFYTISPFHPSTQFPPSILLHNFPSPSFYTISPFHSSTQFHLSILLHNPLPLSFLLYNALSSISFYTIPCPSLSPIALLTFYTQWMYNRKKTWKDEWINEWMNEWMNDQETLWMDLEVNLILSPE